MNKVKDYIKAKFLMDAIRSAKPTNIVERIAKQDLLQEAKDFYQDTLFEENQLKY